jgi:hypothetical protein
MITKIIKEFSSVFMLMKTEVGFTKSREFFKATHIIISQINIIKKREVMSKCSSPNYRLKDDCL